MKSNKKIKVLAIMMVLSLLLTACGGGAPSNEGNGGGDALKLTFATAIQADMPTGMMADWVTNELNSRGEGIVDVTVQQNAVLGSDADLAQQVINGQIPLAAISLSIFSQYTYAFEGIQLPFMIDTLEKEEKVLKSDEYKALVKMVEDQYNIKILATAENGLRHFATVDKEIKTMADLKGLKIRVAPSVITQEAFKLMGANPVSIAYYEVTTALQNRTIDGEEINITSVGSQKHYDVVNYVSEIGMYPFPTLYVMNGDFYNKMTDEQKALFEEVFAEGQDLAFSKFTLEQDAKFKQDCMDNGVAFNEITDKTEFIKAVQPLYETYRNKDPLLKAFIDMALEQ